MDRQKIVEHIAKCSTTLSTLEKIPTDIEVFFNAFEAQLVINVRTMEELGAMRHRLRECLGHWSDRLRNVWECWGTALAAYDSEDWPIEIRLETPLAEFPKEIMGDTCRFEPVTETRYTYVCTKNAEPATACG